MVAPRRERTQAALRLALGLTPAGQEAARRRAVERRREAEARAEPPALTAETAEAIVGSMAAETLSWDEAARAHAAEHGGPVHPLPEELAGLDRKVRELRALHEGAVLGSIEGPRVGAEPVAAAPAPRRALGGPQEPSGGSRRVQDGSQSHPRAAESPQPSPAPPVALRGVDWPPEPLMMFPRKLPRRPALTAEEERVEQEQAELGRRLIEEDAARVARWERAQDWRDLPHRGHCKKVT